MDVVERLILDDTQINTSLKELIVLLRKTGQNFGEIQKEISKFSNATVDDIRQVVLAEEKALVTKQKLNRQETEEWAKGYRARLKILKDWEKDLIKAQELELDIARKQNATVEEKKAIQEKYVKLWGEYEEAYKQNADTLNSAISESVEKTITTVGAKFNNLFSSIGGFFSGVANTLVDKFQAGSKAVGDFFFNVGDKIKNVQIGSKSVGQLGESIGNLGFKISSTVKGLLGFKQSLKESNTELADGAKKSRLMEIASNGLAKAKGALAGGFRLASGAAKAFGAALIATGIGLVVKLLAELMAYLQRTQKGMDLVGKVAAYVSGFLGKFGDEIAKLGEGIVGAFENPKQAISDLWEFLKTNLLNRIQAIPALFVAVGKVMGEAFSLNWDGVKKGLGDVATATVQLTTGMDELQQQNAAQWFKDTTDAAHENGLVFIQLKERRKALEEATNQLILKEAQMSVALEKAKKDADDITLGYTKRIEAAKTAVNLEQGILAGRIKLAKEGLSIAEAEYEAGEKTREKFGELQQIRAEVLQLTAESLKKQAELQEKVNALLKEAENRYKAVRNSIVSELKELELLNPEIEFNIVKEGKLEELQKNKKELEDQLALMTDLAAKAQTLQEREDYTKRIAQIKEYSKYNEDLLEVWANKQWRQNVWDAIFIDDVFSAKLKKSIAEANKEIEKLKGKEALYGVSFAVEIEEQEKIKEKLEAQIKQAGILKAIIKGEIDFDVIQKKKLSELLFPTNSEIEARLKMINASTKKVIDNIDEELNSEETKYSRVKELERQKLEIILQSLMQQRAAYKLTVNEETVALDEQIKETQEALNGLGENTTLPFQNAQEMWQFMLKEMFGSKAQDAINGFTKGASVAFGEFNKLIEETQRLQIEQIDKQLEKLSEKREDLEKSLDYELELREQGLANNVGDKQKEVDAILAEEERLNKEKEAIQEKAQKRQFAIDTANQAQALITSAIQIFEGFSKIPFGLGIPLAVTTIAAMFAFFAKTKVDAYKATRLSTGADRISDHFGYGERYGATDLEGRGAGYRLINEATGKPTNVIISGREMILPERFSLEHELFFQKMKSGAYNGMDLNAALGFYMNYKNKGAGGSVMFENKTISIKEKPNRQWIPFVTKDGKSGAVLRTVNEKEKDGSTIYFDI